MKRVLFICGLFICLSAIASAQEVMPPPPPPDSTVHDSTMISDSLAFADSLFAQQPAKEQLPPLPPPVRLIDSVASAFVRNWQTFDIQQNDVYPREAAGFVYHSASYFAQTYQETPQRTIVAPFGLTGAQMSVRSGGVLLRPYDRVIPVDGRTDFNDIATGDVGQAGLIEGPLSAYDNLNSGVSTLYLEPFEIPEGPATSQFIVERGAYGYAYTRGRFARAFSEKLKIAFSTDYRNGEGFRYNAEDNSYYVKSRVIIKPFRATTVDMNLNVYRRDGDFQIMPDSGGFVFNRFRRDQQFVATVTQHNIAGGELTARFDYQSSRSQYTSFSTTFYRTVRPHFYDFNVSYLKAVEGTIFEIVAGIGKETYDINDVFLNRESASFTGNVLKDFAGGKLFALGRVKNIEYDHPAYDAVAGLSRQMSEKSKAIVSVGRTTNFPNIVDRYGPARTGLLGNSGSLANYYYEHSNTGLQPETRLYGNLTLTQEISKGDISFSLNAGKIDDAIYYDHRYLGYPPGEVFPANDNIKFADANLTARLSDIGPFFGVLSGTYRKVDSDRYGNRPPYSPRWQTFGQAGLKYYITRYDIYTRAFVEMTYYDTPLNYKLDELFTGALVTWGINASMQSFTFYYQMHNALNNYNENPTGYGPSTWYYSWGINWKFLD
ncbi:MAG: TonB-dependent receptor [Candidatus Zixiibacteriota bacterium]